MRKAKKAKSVRPANPLLPAKKELSDWVKNGTAKEGKSQEGCAIFLADALGGKYTRQTINKMTTGERPVYTGEVQAIARYIEDGIPPITRRILESFLNNHSPSRAGDPVMLQIRKEVKAGDWKEVGAEPKDLGYDATTIDLDYPDEEQCAFCFLGDSMPGFFKDKTVLFCIGTKRVKPVGGSLVIVERNRAGLVETSARVMKIYDDRIEYTCINEAYRPIVVRNKRSSEGETVQVVAIIRRWVTNAE